MKKFAALLALIMLTALSFLPVHEAESRRADSNCSGWYDTNYDVLEVFADGSVNMRVTYKQKCQGQETTHTYCFWSDADGIESHIIDCP